MIREWIEKEKSKKRVWERQRVQFGKERVRFVRLVCCPRSAA